MKEKEGHPFEGHRGPGTGRERGFGRDFRERGGREVFGRGPGFGGHEVHEGTGREHGGLGHMGWGRGGRGPGGRGRMERGALRILLLDALRDAPRHGYEIMKNIEERAGGRYVPSPGTIYPTLQLLEDEGLIRAEQQTDRRVFQLTEAGRAELEKEAARISEFWQRLATPVPHDAVRQEVDFLRDEMNALYHTVWGSIRESIESGDRAAIRRMRQFVQAQHEAARDFIVNAAEPSEGKE